MDFQPASFLWLADRLVDHRLDWVEARGHYTFALGASVEVAERVEVVPHCTEAQCTTAWILECAEPVAEALNVPNGD